MWFYVMLLLFITNVFNNFVKHFLENIFCYRVLLKVLILYVTSSILF